MSTPTTSTRTTTPKIASSPRCRPRFPTTSPKMTCSNSVRRSLTATMTGNGPPARSVQRLDRRDRHQFLHGMGEMPVEGDQRVGMELGQGHVLGVECVRPPEQDSGLPCDVLEDTIPQQPDPQPAHVVELSLGILPRHLTAT